VGFREAVKQDDWRAVRRALQRNVEGDSGGELHPPEFGHG